MTKVKKSPLARKLQRLEKEYDKTSAKAVLKRERIIKTSMTVMKKIEEQRIDINRKGES